MTHDTSRPGASLLTSLVGLRRASGLALCERQPLPSGLGELDRALGGGLPVGRITELRGGGQASLLVALAAQVTSRGGLVAWMDPASSLDIRGIQEPGVVLDRVLWVRPRTVPQAVRAADLVLGAEGFSLVILDLASLSPDAWRGVNQDGAGFQLDVAAWNRLAHRAWAHQVALVLCSDRPLAGAAAALTLDVRLASPRWTDGTLWGATLEVSVLHRKGGAPGFKGRIPVALWRDPRDV